MAAFVSLCLLFSKVSLWGKIFLFFIFYLGLPLALLGSGCFAARYSLGPARASPAGSAAFGGPAVHPSACGGFAALKMAFCLDSPLG
ncbi:hypothetical protein SGRA_2586 [Saprospira grandis str. Lewin]|uniref:Uncharacterized protein n=1 Tax=Saprospira grandis (strain Lewin) TaxID=984262 RepID=H6L6R8_SAPGL|nr:hypothetical protein SGRA_2586 [Saprospira grandis str. Lewin]